MLTTLTHNILVLGSVAALIGCCLLLGSWLIERFGGAFAPAERLLLSIVVGAGVVSTIILVLGWIHAINPIALWTSILGVALPGRHQGPHLLAGLREIRKTLDGWSQLSGAIMKVLLAAIAFVLMLAALPPTTDWDSLMYHLEIPTSFMKQGQLFLPADNLHVAFVGALHMLYLPLLSVSASSGPAVLNASFAVLCGLAVLCLGERLFGRPTSVLAFIALWGSSMLVMVAATPRIDVSVAFVLFLVHYLVITAADDGDSRRLLWAAAVAGFAIGVKYHALLYLAAMLPVAAWVICCRSALRVDRVRLLLTCAGIMTCTAMPWLVKNATLLGAPLYPLMADVILPPWLAEISGSNQVPADVSPATFEVLAQAREPISLRTLLLDPAKLTVEAEAQDFGVPPVLLVLPLAVLFLRSGSLFMLIVPALGYVMLLIAVTQYINLRYLIPAVPALVLASTESLRRLGARLGDRSWQDALLLLALVSLLPAGDAVRRTFATSARAGAVVGVVSDSAYLATSSVPGFRSYYSAIGSLNAHTDETSRTLLLFEARGYYFDRAVLQDNNLTNWPLLQATGAPTRCLQGTGITHVVVNHGAAAYYHRRGADLRALQWHTFPRFAERCLRLVATSGGYEIFRVSSQLP